MTMSKKITSVILSVIVCVILLVVVDSTTEPSHQQPQYRSESWRGGPDYGQYMSDIMPDTGIFAVTSIEPNEPFGCYPTHSGNVSGLSDTITITISLHNRNSSDFDIFSYKPENWFIPVLYESFADPRVDSPIADSSTLGYSFEYWGNWFNQVVSKPTALPKAVPSTVRYTLQYYVWNLPVGTSRLMMDTTGYAPAGFRLLMRNVIAVWVTKPTTLADTLNAFGACFWRTIREGSPTLAMNWCDSILAYHPSSITGYFLRARGYNALGDTGNAVTAFDTVISIGENYTDYLVPDSSSAGPYDKMWLNDVLSWARLVKWRIRTNTTTIYVD